MRGEKKTVSVDILLFFRRFKLLSLVYARLMALGDNCMNQVLMQLAPTDRELLRLLMDRHRHRSWQWNETVTDRTGLIELGSREMLVTAKTSSSVTDLCKNISVLFPLIETCCQICQDVLAFDCESIILIE